MADEVMAALSEVLHDMTRDILDRKRDKSGAPDKLVAAVGAVDKCTSRLEGIAVALAKDEYEDFPAIQKEIFDAANEVRKGSGEMAAATKALQAGGGDVESAWDNVGAAVGRMVTKTMLLLDIVYGAQVRVLQQCSSAAVGALDALAAQAQAAGPHTDDDGVDALLEAAKKAAAAVKPLLEKLKSAAKSEPNPQTKRQLEAQAESLLSKTNAVLQAANAFAQSPERPEPRAALLKAVEALDRELAPLSTPLGALIPRVKKATDDAVKEARKLKMGKGKDGPAAPPGKKYRVVQPAQWDPEEEAERPWPRLRHVEPNEKQPGGPHVPAWANAALRPSAGPAAPTSPRSAGGSTSPRVASPAPGAPSSPGREPYGRGPKEAGQSSSPRRGWKPGQGAPGEEGPPGRGIRIVPPRQLPFDPADPPMAWPVLRHVEPNAPRTFPPSAFPWAQLRPFMAPAAVQDALSHMHHALERGDSDVVREQLKLVEEAAPALGAAAHAAVKKELDGFEAAARADPAAAQERLRRALRQTAPVAEDDKGPREIRFKPIEQLPPAQGAPPFPWPKLRHWTGESLVTLADEIEETLREWQERQARGDKNEDECRTFTLSALEYLHDVLAPRFGDDSAAILKRAAQEAHTLASAKKVDFEAVRKALRPLVPEANLPPAWLTALRARNAAKRQQTPAVAELCDVLSSIRGALEDQDIPEAARRRAIELLSEMQRLASGKDLNQDSLVSASEQLVRVLQELLQLHVLPSQLLQQLSGAVRRVAPSGPPALVSPRTRGRGFDNAATRAAEIASLKLPPQVKVSQGSAGFVAQAHACLCVCRAPSC